MGLGNASWYFCDQTLATDSECVLSEDESRHAIQVKRIGEGDALVVFNGHGKFAVGEVVSLSRRTHELRVRLQQVDTQPRPQQLSIAFSVPKGDRQSTLIDMCVQLGVGSIQPLKLRYSSVNWKDSYLQRWQRIAVSACKQSRRAWLPEFLPQWTLAEVLDGIGNQHDSMPTTILHGDQDGQFIPMQNPDILTRPSLYLIIGPEAGFDDSEKRMLLRYGSSPVNASPYVLRTETAAVALVALIGALHRSSINETDRKS
ncbi:MAG: RsmE family RNA methyltransferase [Pseudomonadota bacterium]